MFSDESHFELQLGERSGCSRRPVGSDQFDPKFTKMSLKHHGHGHGVGGVSAGKAVAVLSFSYRVR